MIAVYIAIGLLLLFSNYFLDYISENRMIMGFVFLAYAIFRLVLTIQRIRKLKKSNLN